MHLRPLQLQRFLRLLLLAVFFNAAIGMPAHEAGHLRQAMVDVAQSAAPEAGLDAASPEHEEEARGLCAWCLAYVHHAVTPARLSFALEAVQPAALLRPARELTFVPGPQRWPFASRDPPHAST